MATKDYSANKYACQCGHGNSGDGGNWQYRLEEWEEDWSGRETERSSDLVDPILKKHFPGFAKGEDFKERKLRILVPLAGKTPDMIWLAEQGHHVVGVEYVGDAMKSFFKNQELHFTSEQSVGGMIRHKCTDASMNIEVWEGHFYQCNSEVLGQFDVVWDYGSWTGATNEDQTRYIQLVLSLLNNHGIILLSIFTFGELWFKFDVKKAFGHSCSVELLETLDSFYGTHQEKGCGHGCQDTSVQRCLYLVRGN